MRQEMFYLNDDQSTMESGIVTQKEKYIFDSLVFDTPRLLNQRRSFSLHEAKSSQFNSFR